MGDESLLSCNNQEEWDRYLDENRLVVVCFITSNSPSRELIQTMKALAPGYATGNSLGGGSSSKAAGDSTAKTPEYATVTFLQVDVNNFKPRHKDFKVTEVPFVMFVNNKERAFPEYNDLNAQKLKDQIEKLAEGAAEIKPSVVVGDV